MLLFIVILDNLRQIDTHRKRERERQRVQGAPAVGIFPAQVAGMCMSGP